MGVVAFFATSSLLCRLLLALLLICIDVAFALQLGEQQQARVGHFVVVLNNHASHSSCYILCNTDANNNIGGKTYKLVLVNINDAIANDICLQSSTFSFVDRDRNHDIGAAAASAAASAVPDLWFVPSQNALYFKSPKKNTNTNKDKEKETEEQSTTTADDDDDEEGETQDVQSTTVGGGFVVGDEAELLLENAISLEFIHKRVFRMKINSDSDSSADYVAIQKLNGIPILSQLYSSSSSSSSSATTAAVIPLSSSSSPTSPTSEILNFTFIPITDSPFLDDNNNHDNNMKNKKKNINPEIVSHWSLDALNEVLSNHKNILIGERLRLRLSSTANEEAHTKKGPHLMKSGVIRWIRNANQYLIDFDDGTMDVINVDTKHIRNHSNDSTHTLLRLQKDRTRMNANQKYADVHLKEFLIGDEVDCYWPADRLKLSNLANVLWPATVINKSNASFKSQEFYTVRFEDGSVYPNMPLIWIKPRMPCIDERFDCPLIAAKDECKLNPGFAMIHCRKACQVCTQSQSQSHSESQSEHQNNSTATTATAMDIEFYKVWIDTENEKSLAIRTSPMQSPEFSPSLEGNALNEIGEQLLLLGNISLAESYFKHASFLGNSESKFNLAHLHAIQGNVSHTVLNLYFAASTGSLSGKLALGYRHLYGYGVPKSCTIAGKYYLSAAETLFSGNSLNSYGGQGGGGGGQHIEMISLSDEARRDLPINENEDIIRFYHARADNGDANAQLALAQLYLYGLRGFEQNIELAFELFERAAANENNGDAYAYLGNMYADGSIASARAKAGGRASRANETQRQHANYSQAIEYYQKAIALKSVAGHTGLGYLHLEGLGFERKNVTLALFHFKEASKKGDINAQYYLGLMYFNGIGVKLSYDRAFEYFVHASRRGHSQALYYTGYMHLHGIATAKSCKMGVEVLKLAAERTQSATMISKARSFYLDENYDKAFYLYSKSSQEGFEVAQANAGWLLKEKLVNPSIVNNWFVMNHNHEHKNQSVANDSDSDSDGGNDNGNDTRTTTTATAAAAAAAAATDVSKKYNKSHAMAAAFSYLEWSAFQNNPDSQRFVGDYYYYYKDDMQESATYYQMAAENLLTPDAQAMWNLGYMHMYGYGKRKDFEMSKRYFDLSLQTNQKSKIACYLALTLLYWNHFCEQNQHTVNYYYHYQRSLSNGMSIQFWKYFFYVKGIDNENLLLGALFGLLIVVFLFKQRYQ